MPGVAPVASTRINASSDEQKLRTPVKLSLIGTAVAKYLLVGGPPALEAAKL